MRKYKKGRKIQTMEELATVLGAGGNVYIRHKFTHQGWLLSMQYRVIWNAVKSGVMWEAIENNHMTDKE